MKNEQNFRDFKGIWIPKIIWFAKDLSGDQKLLLAEIDSLDHAQRGCTAQNEYFCEFFGWDERKLQRHLKKLISLKYISIKLIKGTDKRTLRSKIRVIVEGTGDKNVATLRQKCRLDPIDKPIERHNIFIKEEEERLTPPPSELELKKAKAFVEEYRKKHKIIDEAKLIIKDVKLQRKNEKPKPTNEEINRKIAAMEFNRYLEFPSNYKCEISFVSGVLSYKNKRKEWCSISPDMNHEHFLLAMESLRK